MPRHRILFILFLAGSLACGGAAVLPTDDGGTAGSGPGGSRADASGDGEADLLEGSVEPADARLDSARRCDRAMVHPVTFHLTEAKGVDYCAQPCRLLWLSIFPATGGQPLQIVRSCSSTCDECIPMSCDGACPLPHHMTPEGETFAWDGELWGSSTCGAYKVICDEGLCMPPGQYVARMCGNKAMPDAADCTYGTPPTCVDVPFDYPTTTPVEGMLP